MGEHFEDWIQLKCSIMADKHEKSKDKEMFLVESQRQVRMGESSITTMVWQMLIIRFCLIEVN